MNPGHLPHGPHPRDWTSVLGLIAALGLVYAAAALISFMAPWR